MAWLQVIFVESPRGLRGGSHTNTCDATIRWIGMCLLTTWIVVIVVGSGLGARVADKVTCQSL
eukprot:15453038-Alexandrium_andersonii.AAC.1